MRERDEQGAGGPRRSPPPKSEVDEVLERWDATAPAMQRLILIRMLEKLCNYRDALLLIAADRGAGCAAGVARRALEEG